MKAEHWLRAGVKMRFYLPNRGREKAEDAAEEQKMWVLIKRRKQR
jgi:hypothetical protein